MDDKKICIILYSVNDNCILKLKESLYGLIMPEGYSLELFEISGEECIANAYNEAMNDTDAKYKVYIYGETYFWGENNDMLCRMIEIFSREEQIGMIGCYGAVKIPTDGVWCHSKKMAGSYVNGDCRIEGSNDMTNNFSEVEVVSGMMMATQYDVEWRADLELGNMFYDSSQCIEYSKKGYKCVVLDNDSPYIRSISDYNYVESDRDVFLNEYSKYIYPLVSIGIATYNRPEYMEKALQSAIGQTYRNIEVLVSDNGHFPDTREVVKRYMEMDNRVSYVSTDESGEFANWYNLFRCFSDSSEYIQLLCDDDILISNKLEVMVQYFFDYDNLSLITSYRKLIDKDGIDVDEPSNQPVYEKVTMVNGGIVIDNLMTSLVNFIGEPTTPLISKKHLKDNILSKDYHKIRNTDWPSWIRLMLVGDLLYIPTPLSYFRIHPEQGTETLGNSFFVENWISYGIITKIFLTKEREHDYITRDKLNNWVRLFISYSKFVCAACSSGEVEQELKEAYAEIKDYIFQYACEGE